MTNLFSSSKDEEAQQQFAMLNPITIEEMELSGLKTQTKIDAIAFLLLIVLVAFITYKYKQKTLLAIVWICLSVGAIGYGVVRKNEFDTLQKKAVVAHQEAVDKAMKKINEEAFKKLSESQTPIQIENKQLITSVQIRELMPKAPATKSIDMICSSLSTGYATCSGTITEK